MSQVTQRLQLPNRQIHFTASQIIRKGTGPATWNTDKLVVEIDYLQNAFIRAVRRRCAAGQDILLESYFVFRDSSGSLKGWSKKFVYTFSRH